MNLVQILTAGNNWHHLFCTYVQFKEFALEFVLKGLGVHLDVWSRQEAYSDSHGEATHRWHTLANGRVGPSFGTRFPRGR